MNKLKLPLKLQSKLWAFLFSKKKKTDAKLRMGSNSICNSEIATCIVPSYVKTPFGLMLGN